MWNLCGCWKNMWSTTALRATRGEDRTSYPYRQQGMKELILSFYTSISILMSMEFFFVFDLIHPATFYMTCTFWYGSLLLFFLHSILNSFSSLHEYSAKKKKKHAAVCFVIQRRWGSKPEGETCQNKYARDETEDVSCVTFLTINAFSAFWGFFFFFWTAC